MATTLARLSNDEVLDEQVAFPPRADEAAPCIVQCQQLPAQSPHA